jgi:hypothetical protein
LHSRRKAKGMRRPSEAWVITRKVRGAPEVGSEFGSVFGGTAGASAM